MSLVSRAHRTAWRLLGRPALVEPAPSARRDFILKHVRKDLRGLEIGPNYAPLAPRSAGYDCLSLDIFPTAEVRRRAAEDPNTPSELVAEIEPVDIIGSAVDIGALVTDALGAHSLDYVLSSHNFEHLPDPIRFLQGCAVALKPGGYISMAVPDLRCCLDYFRWPTVLAEWLAAYFAARSRPTPAQLFNAVSMFSPAMVGGAPVAGFSMDTPRADIVPDRRLREAYDDWRAEHDQPTGDYRDCHCWAFTPSSLAQLLLEARFLGLVAFEIEEVTDLLGGEFFVHLRQTDDAALSPAVFYAERERLARAAIQEISRKA